MQDYNVVITQQRYKETIRFWQLRLEGVDRGFRWEVGGESSPPNEHSEHCFSFCPSASDVLNRFASDDIGRFAIIASAVAYVLSRYSQRSSIILKTPPIVSNIVSNMDSDGSPVIPIIINVQEELNVAQYLRETAEIVGDTYSLNGFPLEEFLEERYELSFGQITNVAVRDEQLHELAAEFDDEAILIRLNVNGTGEHRICHKLDQSESFVVSAFAAHVVQVLEQFGDLSRSLRTIEFLCNQQKTAGRSARTIEQSETVVSLFEKQVLRTPDSTALADQDHAVSYRELNAQANRLAWHLSQTAGGCGAGAVGIMLDRSFEMLIAVLAALKAGAPYVPIDPQYPAERIKYILEDAGVAVLIIESHRLLELADLATPVFAIDVELSALTTPVDNLYQKPEPEEASYIIYTSGSTGAPKGCVLEHRNLANYLCWATGYYFPDESTGNFGLYSSLAFDFTITNIFCPLLRGKTLFIYDQSQSIAEILQHAFGPEGAADTMKLTSSHILLLEEIGGEGANIKKVIAGGEELRPIHVQILKKINPAIEVYNEYGPTEATVGCIIKLIEPDEPQVLIGKPIDNMSAYILDARDRLVPASVRGEICVAGDGVARGYNNLPDMTAARFIPNPFEEGGRLYKTGDIGRWLPDGNIQCFGRTDDQVKIRGFRVELGEVERTLAQHPEVQQAVVLAEEDETGLKRLVAYVIGSHVVTASALREFAASKLPSFMSPSSFVVLEKFPINVNGKVDKKALAGCEHIQKNTALADMGKITAEEAEILRLWQEILHHQPIGLHDNFFAVGGDSLSAVQLASRIWSKFGVEILVEDIFDTPTVSGLAARIAGAGQNAGRSNLAPIAAGPRPEVIPLSFAQQRLWFLDQLQPGNPAYNIPVAVRVSGGVDVAALELSLNEIARRHEILRTCIKTVDGRPSQAVAAGSNLCIDIVKTGSEDEAMRLAGVEARRSFDLARGPLIRTALFCLNDDDRILLLTMHHIVTDEWSTGILLDELRTLYEAYRTGENSPLKNLEVQYADYAIWQRSAPAGELLEAQLQYWKSRMAGLPGVLEFPIDRPRPMVQSFSGAVESFEIAQPVYERLKRLSLAENASFFMVLLAAFDVLPYRYTGEEDIAVGSPVANRNRVETEALIGFFSNTLVFRTDLRGDPSFGVLLARVREMAFGAYENQDLPFEKLVDELQPERDPQRTPLFQIAFVFENAARERIELPSLTFTPIAIDTGAAKFDLLMALTDTGETLSGMIQYNTDLFLPPTVSRLIGHFRTLLGGIATNPDSRISMLPMLTEAERAQLLAESGQSCELFSKTLCLTGIFEDQVEQTPDSIALQFEDSRLSYSELNRRANQLASLLRGAGVRAGAMAAICLERSPEMLIATLGILKTGAAYVPLDPVYPKERLAFVLENSKARVLLTQENLREALPENDVRIICLDSGWSEIAQQDDGDAIGRIDPDSPAYVIYTSGSTGRPKGVVVTHHNVVRLFQATPQFQFGRNDVWSMFHSYAFDISVWEMWGAWLHGGRLVLVPYWISRTPEQFYDLMKSERTTVLTQTPSAFRQLIPLCETRERMALRAVIFGGEALDFQNLKPWMLRYGDDEPRLVNMYGITETTVHVSYRQVLLEDVMQIKGSLIGGPMDDLGLYVLDSHQELIPPGVKGEIYVAGDGIAQGYLNNPELTAERFIPNPFGVRKGERLYRSGDLAKRLTDGDVEYLGRRDHQVKIRGFRVEPGEIESVISQHPLVRECVVIAHESGTGRVSLAAYFVAKAEHAVSAGELHGFLKQKMPDYMVPAAIVEMNALPLTQNGKVDKRALPEPNRSARDTNNQAPRTPAERSLARIWSQVLGVERIAIHDNFFELGGDSILSIQVVSRAKDSGFRITTQQIFQRQTIAELAAVGGSNSVEAEQSLVTGPIPLTPIQHWFFEHRRVGWNHFNQSVLLDTPPGLVPDLLQRAVDRVVLHHDALRLRFKPESGGWTQVGLGKTEPVQIRSIDLSQAPAVERAKLLEEAAGRLQEQLNIEEGPLIGVAYFNLDPDRPGRLLIIVHHLAIDGVSWRILIEDLISVYEQLQYDVDALLYPKTTSFKEWSQRLQAWSDLAADSADVRGELRYWASPAGQTIGTLPLLTADGGSNAAGNAETFKLSLGGFDTQILLEWATRHYGAQANEILIAAAAISLSEWTGGGAVLIDLEGHGREDLFEGVDLSRTVGWFTTIFPAVLELPRGAAPDEVLRSVKDQLRATPRRGIGYGLLRYCSGDAEIRRSLQALPVAQVAFNYLGRTDTVLSSSRGWRLAAESTGLDQAPDGSRAHVLEINSIVTGKQLHIQLVYNRELLSADAIARLADSIHGALRYLLAGCSPALIRGFEAAPELNPDRIEEVYLLSPLQPGLLFTTSFQPQSDAYFEQLSCTISGPLDVGLFRQAWQFALDRHAVLRTAFFWESLEQPLQIVFREVALPWEVRDWSGLEPDEQARRFEEFLDQDRTRKFDLTKAPAFRLVLFSCGPNRHAFYFSYHHIILDGWSVANLIQEVTAFYAAGGSPLLPEVRPYRSYIDWVQSQDRAEAERFWRDHLKGFASPTKLPFDKKQSSGLGYDKEELLLSESLSDQLRALLQQRRLTLNTLARGAWAILLSACCNEEDVLFGVTLSGRPAALDGVESMVGLFINTLPLRVRVSRAAALSSWLRGLQGMHTDIESFSHSSLAEVQQWAEIPAGVRLFESILVFENYPVDQSLDSDIGGLALSDVQAFEETEYPLNFQFVPDRRLLIRLRYDKQRFTAESVRRMLSYMEIVLEAFAANPDRSMADIRIPYADEPQAVACAAPAEAQSARMRYVPPRDAVERKLVEIWRNALELDELGVRDDFFELGGHSILALKLVGRIRSQFGKTIPLPQLFKNPTVEKLAETLRDDNASLESQPIVRMSHGGSGLPIFLLPGASGNVLYLYELAKRLGPGRPVYGLQAVGLDGVTPVLASVEEIAQYNIERIRDEQPDGPYILVGHSFGGKVAFEMSRHLFASGHQVGMLAILDTPAPVFRPISDREDWDDAQWLIQMVRELEEFLGIKVPMIYQELKALPEDEQLDLVINRIQATGWWLRDGDRSQLRGYLQVFKTSVRIDSNFRIDYENLRELPPTPIVLIKASTGHDAVSNPELSALFKEEAWGWDKLSPELVRIHQVPGDHITMMSEGRAENVAEKLRASLAQLRLN